MLLLVPSILQAACAPSQAAAVSQQRAGGGGGGGGDLRDHGGEQEVHQLQIRQVSRHRHGPRPRQGQYTSTIHASYILDRTIPKAPYYKEALNFF